MPWLTMQHWQRKGASCVFWHVRGAQIGYNPLYIEDESSVFTCSYTSQGCCHYSWRANRCILNKQQLITFTRAKVKILELQSCHWSELQDFKCKNYRSVFWHLKEGTWVKSPIFFRNKSRMFICSWTALGLPLLLSTTTCKPLALFGMEQCVSHALWQVK